MDIDAFSMDFFSLKGKTAIVTGGNSGLGLAFSTALAKAGANIFIPTYVMDDGKARQLIEKQGVEVELMQIDITQKGAPKQIMDVCLKKFNRLDILV
ncbi:SDR family NAD(P)-dependent oxidoreductase, partial [Desulfobacula sp.]